MKELEKQTAIEIKAEQQQKKEIKLIGRQRKQPGLTLFEFDKKTGLLALAEFKKYDLVVKSTTKAPNSIVKSSRVMVKDDCFYIQALNYVNAIRKLSRLGFKVKVF